MSLKDVVWAEKYRPKKIEDIILPENIKNTFREMIENGTIPNLLLTGKPGVGKTTMAKILVDVMGGDFLLINGSLDGNIGTLRNDIMNFASSISFTGNRKFVILDESEFLNPNSTQPALRNFMEEFSKNCGFILTCNNKSKIIEPLKSRCSVVDFTIPRNESSKMAGMFLNRFSDILVAENVKFEKKTLAAIIQKHFPDWRKCLNELQKCSVSGILNYSTETESFDESFSDLMEIVKSKKLAKIRTWASENSHIDPSTFFRKFYDFLFTGKIQSSCIPMIIITLADYQFKAEFVSDQEINIAACIIEISASIVWKET